MSRSENTVPCRLRDSGLEQRAATFALPRGTGRYLRRKWQKGRRQQVRAALRRQDEPLPDRPRHSVIWDYW